MNKKKVVIAALGLLGAFATAPVYADTIWDWSLTTNLGSGTGTFTTSGSSTAADTAFTITAITGTFGGDTINGLDSSFLGADNMFEWDGTTLMLLDGFGVSFDTALPSSVNFYCGSCVGNFGTPSNIGVNVAGVTNFGTISDATIDPEVDNTTPEPATSALLIAGAAVLLARRFQRGH